MKQSNNKIKITIIILSVVLAISLISLGALVIYSLNRQQQSTVTVPENIISFNDKQSSESGNGTVNNDGDKEEVDDGDTESDNSADEQTEDDSAVTPEASADVPTAVPTTSYADGDSGEEVTAIALRLYEGQNTDNAEFYVSNMFPGDTDTQYYGVQISYKDAVTLKYHADIRPGYELLSEVLKCRITLMNDGSVLYDGLMKDMPESVDYNLTSAEGKTEEIYYQIDVYLDTSVGNEYQNTTLIADFRWWVEGDNLIPPPQTGDNYAIVIWSAVAVASLLMILILVFVRRKKERKTYE